MNDDFENNLPEGTESFTTDELNDGVVGLPSYSSGGRVDRTGLALVHEGEYVVPASGSEAVITPSNNINASQKTVSFNFPVEVEIVSELSESQIQKICETVFEELQTALDSQQ